MNEYPHDHKPSPRFFGDGDTYLGIELEVEAPDHATKRAGLNLEARPNWMYAKRDGSLSSTGWEMVTHPISVKLWMTRDEVRDYHNILPGTVLTARYKGETYTATALDGGRIDWNGHVYGSISAAGKAIRGGKSTNGYQFFGLVRDNTGPPNPTMNFFRLVESLRQMGYTSHDNTRCGFHIHVSRKAFSPNGDVQVPMYYVFKYMVNGALFRDLSQRRSFQYCQQEPVTQQNYFRYPSSRYCALNLTRSTVEVRLFRGNMRENRLRKNVEAVIAALEFSKEFVFRPPGYDWAAPLDADFKSYVSRWTDRFPNLSEYLRSHRGDDSCV